MPPLQIEHKVVGVELMVTQTRQPFREKLVEIAFKKRLAFIVARNGTFQDGSAGTVAKDVVEYVDTLLAAMKKPEAENKDAK